MPEEFPTFASDVTNRDSWELAPLALCVGVLCFRVVHEYVWRLRWEVFRGVCGCSRNKLFCACMRPFLRPTKSHHELSAVVMRVKCDLLFGFHLASWTAVDLITAHCVHTHKPISTLLDKQQMQILLCGVTVIQVNLRPGHDISSMHCTDGRCICFHDQFVFLWQTSDWASRHV